MSWFFCEKIKVYDIYFKKLLHEGSTIMDYKWLCNILNSIRMEHDLEVSMLCMDLSKVFTLKNKRNKCFIWLPPYIPLSQLSI